MMYIANEHLTGIIPIQIEAPDSAVFYFSVGCSPVDDGVKVGNMKKISLSQGEFALVDDEDYEWLNQWKWYANKKNRGWGYAWYVIRSSGSYDKIAMHRLILDAPQRSSVDHINGNGLDNRRENIRLCTATQNSYNQQRPYGASKYKGVFWCKKAKKWYVQTRILGKLTYLGSFLDERRAAKEYDRIALIHFGEFAKTNKMLGLLNE